MNPFCRFRRSSRTALATAPRPAADVRLPVSAQAPAAPETPPADLFGETIEVRVVNVEVVVTDRDGNRVTGLGPGDLKLKVDGKDVPIEFFTEVRGGDAIAPVAGAEPSIQGLPSLAPGTPVGTSYLVFIDDFFSLNVRRDEVLRRLKDDVTRLGPEDRMAVVAYDGRDVEMLTSWSSSQNTLSRVFDQAMVRPARGLERLAEQRTFGATNRLTANTGLDRVDSRQAFFNRLTLEELDYAERSPTRWRRRWPPRCRPCAVSPPPRGARCCCCWRAVGPFRRPTGW